MNSPQKNATLGNTSLMPQEEKIETGQIVISTLQTPNQEKEFFQALQRKKVTALTFVFLKDEYDQYPIVRSMSEVAGSASLHIAAEYLSNVHQGRTNMVKLSMVE